MSDTEKNPSEANGKSAAPDSSAAEAGTVTERPDEQPGFERAGTGQSGADQPLFLARVRGWFATHDLRHIYGTRIRTTTVILVLALIFGFMFWADRDNYWNGPPPPPAQRTVEQTEEPEPTVEETTEEPEESAPVSPSELPTDPETDMSPDSGTPATGTPSPGAETSTTRGTTEGGLRPGVPPQRTPGNPQDTPPPPIG